MYGSVLFSRSQRHLLRACDFDRLFHRVFLFKVVPITIILWAAIGIALSSSDDKEGLDSAIASRVLRGLEEIWSVFLSLISTVVH